MPIYHGSDGSRHGHGLKLNESVWDEGLRAVS